MKHGSRTLRSPVALGIITAAVGVALLAPWASSPLAAERALLTHTTDACLDTDATTFPVKLNVGTYRPPHPGPYGLATQAPGPDNNNYDIDNFRYIVNLDNSGDPRGANPEEHPGVHPMPSSSPLLIEGTATGDSKVLDLPRNCRWLVTVQANVEPGPATHHTSSSHKMWGTHVDLVDTQPGAGYEPRDADGHGEVVKWVDEIPFPLPLGKLVVHVFPDVNPTNGAPDTAETSGIGAEQPGLENFSVVIKDLSDGTATQNFFGDRICARYLDEPGGKVDPDFPGGRCLTGADGTVVIPHLAPGKYEISANPPQQDTDPWYGAIQTTTFEGDSKIDVGTVTEQDDGFGATRERLIAQLAAPTAYWFGFLRPKELPAGPIGRIQACAAHSVAFPPFDTPTLNKLEPIQLGMVALSSVGNDELVYAQPLADDPACPGGVIDIQSVPAGNYTMFIWDERLERIFRRINVSVPATPVDDPASRRVDEALGELRGDDGAGNIGVFRRWGWLSGQIFDDSGVARNGARIGGGAARNGHRDCINPSDQSTCERGLQGQDLAIRFRDGSTKKATLSDASGRYEYRNEISKLHKFVIGEVGFGRFGTSGPCVYTEALSRRDPGWAHSQYNPAASCVLIESNLGGGLLTNQLTVGGHRSTVDWGKYPYDATETAQITGVVYYATTRKEPDPRFAGGEPYEPGIAGVPANLYWAGRDQDGDGYAWDGGPGPRSDDVLVNRYADGAGTDAWEHPDGDGPDGPGPLPGNQGANGGCDVLDSTSQPVFPKPVTHFGLPVAPNCLEFGLTSSETKDGAFDGGYAFADMCDPTTGGWKDTVIVHGTNVGCAKRAALHSGAYVVEVAATENPATPGFPYKIVKEEDVNVDQSDPFVPAVTPFPCVGADHLVQDSRSPFDTKQRPLCTHREITLQPGQSNPGADFFLFTDTPIAGRLFGRVSDDINVETDPDSPWYGEPRAVPNVPIGIRDYAYRLITTVDTDEYGFYETLLPSTQTASCPTPAGTCPATYVVVVNDPEGEKAATGSVAVARNTVTGTGTVFNTEVDVGDRIRVGNDVRVVTGLMDNNTLRVDEAWSAGNAGGALYVLFMNPNFSASYQSTPLTFEVLPGKTTLLDTTVDPIAAVTCSDYAGPEFFKVLESNGDGAPADLDSGVVINRALGASSDLRDVTIRGVGLGARRTNPSVPTQPGLITLIHSNGTQFVVPPANYIRWGDEEITFKFPLSAGSLLPAGPYQVLVSAPPPASLSRSLTAPTGITLHYVSGTGSGYNPRLRFVDAVDGADTPANGSLASPYRTIQFAIDRASAANQQGRLIIVKPGVYHENPVLYVRAKLQGFGAGGINGPKIELRQPEDENRRSNPGTVIDASFFNYSPEIQKIWQNRINTHPNNVYPGGPLTLTGADVKAPAGAGITVVGATDTYSLGGELGRAQIDGFAIHSARTDAAFGTGGGGGIFVVGNGRRLWMTNNFVEGNHGLTGGGIILGQPYLVNDSNSVDNNNDELRIAYNRILGNGGTRFAGGVAIYKGADGYRVDHNNICSNFSAEYGGGISHYGRSRRGEIRENSIYFNAAFDEGGGVMVAGRFPRLGENFNGSGAVRIAKNHISSNQSGDDGGAIKVLGAVRMAGENTKIATPDRVVIVDNMLTNNAAAGIGGAIALRDSPDVRIVNNTIAENASTASCRGCLGGPPHSGGLASEPHSDWLLAASPFSAGGLPEFSNPLLLNDLFYENSSYTFDPELLPATDFANPLEFVELRDFEVLGRPDLTFKPWYSTLSAPYDTGDLDANASNPVFASLETGEDPSTKLYFTAFDIGLNANTSQATVNILNPFLGTEPQTAGNNGIPGDYSLCDPRLGGPSPCSPRAIDQGGDNLPASLFRRTVVPAATGCIRAPDRDIDGDARALDIPFFANSTRPAPCQPTQPTRVGIDIGTDEMRNPGFPWLGPDDLPR